MAAGDTHVIIVGGVSVNDPGEHDKFPYNFMNPAGTWAKKYLASDPGSKVVVIVFAPPYETRVLKQKVEHSSVKLTTTCDFSILGYCLSESANARHFLDVLAKQAKAVGYSVVEARTASDVTDELKRQTRVVTLDYFGHSAMGAMYVQYSTGIAPGRAEVKWDLAEAKKVPSSVFAPNAVFRSFGCYQGDPGGLAQKLRDEWGITAYGSEGETKYPAIGRGEPIPESDKGWFKYPAGGGRISVPSATLKAPSPP